MDTKISAVSQPKFYVPTVHRDAIEMDGFGSGSGSGNGNTMRRKSWL